MRLHAWVPPVALVAAISCAAVLASHAADPRQLRPVERPWASHGDPTVRTGAGAYPRVAIDADGVQVRIAAPPRRLVSATASIDDFLYSVARPERVAGVNESAYLVRISNVHRQAQMFQPAVVATAGGIDAERVLRANPDLFLTSYAARMDTVELVRAAGVPAYRMFTDFTRLEQIEDHIRLVGYLTGEDARAQEEARRFRDAIARAAARRPPGARPRVLGLGGTFTYGSETLFHDICRVLGAENVAATHGRREYERVGAEQIVRWDPEWIIAGADSGKTEETRARLHADPAIGATSAAEHDHIVVLEYRVFLPLSPYTRLLVEALADALYQTSKA
jgi:ABC-type Fe3+-hydroxamate transport system substrate-binding protein